MTMAPTMECSDQGCPECVDLRFQLAQTNAALLAEVSRSRMRIGTLERELCEMKNARLLRMSSSASHEDEDDRKDNSCGGKSAAFLRSDNDDDESDDDETVLAHQPHHHDDSDLGLARLFSSSSSSKIIERVWSWCCRWCRRQTSRTTAVPSSIMIALCAATVLAFVSMMSSCLAAAQSSSSSSSARTSTLCEFPHTATPELLGEAYCTGTYDLSQPTQEDGNSQKTPIEKCVVVDGDIVLAPATDPRLPYDGREVVVEQLRDAPHLRAITGSVVLRSNRNITRVFGLPQLSYIQGDVDIYDNPNLETLDAFPRLRCVGRDFFLERMYKLRQLGNEAFTSLTVVANNDAQAQMRIESTALESLENFASLIRVGAPLDGATNVGQTLTIQYNPNLRDLWGLQNLAVLAPDSSLGGLSGSFGECGSISDLLVRSGNVTWGLCQFPTYFIDQGSQGTFTVNPVPAGPCAVAEQCPQGLRTTDAPLRNNLRAHGTCALIAKQLKCVPTVLTLLSITYAKRTGSFYNLARARGWADELASPSSALTVFAPSDFALMELGGVRSLLNAAEGAVADRLLRRAVGGGDAKDAKIWKALEKGAHVLRNADCLAHGGVNDGVNDGGRCERQGVWVEGGALPAGLCGKRPSVIGRTPFGSPVVTTYPCLKGWSVSNTSLWWPAWSAKIVGGLGSKASNGVVYTTDNALL